MPIQETKSGTPAIPTQELLTWMEGEIVRLAKKLDGATNFPINTKETLSAWPPNLTRPRQPVISDNGALPELVYQGTVWICGADGVAGAGYVTSTDGDAPFVPTEES